MMSSLMATLGLDVSPFKGALMGAQADAKKAGSQLRASFGDALAGQIGLAGGAAAVTGLIGGAVTYAARIRDLSEQFRVSTDTIQLWDKAAKRIGMQAEDVATSYNKVKKARDSAVEKGDVGAFGTFGIGMAELKDAAVTTEELMNRIKQAGAGRSLTDAEDVSAMELMGRSGAKVLSVLQEMQNMGPVSLIDKKDIESLDAADKKIHALKMQLIAGTAEVAGKALPAADSFANWFTGVDQWLKGKLNWKQAKDIGKGEGEQDFNAEAPTTDLKGRPLRQHPGTGTKAEDTGAGTHYSVTKTVNLTKDLAETEKLRDVLAKKILDTQLKGMSIDERRAALSKEIAEAMGKAVAFEFGEGDDVKALKEKIKAEDLRAELAGLDAKEASKEMRDNRYRAPSVNSMQQIGAYVSAGVVDQTALAAKSEAHLAHLNDKMSELLKASNRTKY